MSIPAFPKTGSFHDNATGKFDSENQNGMRLLDYFAAKALPECIKIAVNFGENPASEVAHEEIAKASYQIAEAMVKESEKRNAS